MRIFYIQSSSYFCQHPIGGIEKCFSTGIVLRPEPLSFHDSPQRFSNVQVWRIRRNVEKEETPFFPDRPSLSNLCVSMYACIIEYHKCLFLNFKRILLEKVDNSLCINRLIRTKAFEMIVSAGHSKDIESFSSLRRYIYILSKELPSIWDIAFGTNVRFIAVKEIDFALRIKRFKFLQLMGFICIKLRRGDSLGRFLIRLYLAPRRIKNVWMSGRSPLFQKSSARLLWLNAHSVGLIRWLCEPLPRPNSP